MNPMSAASRSEWDKMVAAVREIDAKGKKVKKEDRVFQVLYIYVGFQLFTSAQDEVVESLGDLHVCR